MAEKAGVFDRLFISADDTSYTELEFLPNPTLGFQGSQYNSDGLRGGFDVPATRTRENVGQVGGSISFAPNPAELDLLLFWVTGATKSGNNYAPTSTTKCLARYLRTARDGDFDLYTGCKVQSAQFTCAVGQPLTVTLQIVGETETTGSTLPGTLTAIDDTDGPYMMSDCVLSVASTEYPFRQMQITYENVLKVDHNNSITPSRITHVDRRIQAGFSFPHGDTTALYNPALAGVAVVATFTHASAGKSLTITMPKVQVPREPKPFGQRGDTSTMSWNGVVRKTSGSAIITFANDSTA